MCVMSDLNLAICNARSVQGKDLAFTLQLQLRETHFIDVL